VVREMACFTGRPPSSRWFWEEDPDPNKGTREEWCKTRWEYADGFIGPRRPVVRIATTNFSPAEMCGLTGEMHVLPSSDGAEAKLAELHRVFEDGDALTSWLKTELGQASVKENIHSMHSRMLDMYTGLSRDWLCDCEAQLIRERAFKAGKRTDDPDTGKVSSLATAACDVNVFHITLDMSNTLLAAGLDGWWLDQVRGGRRSQVHGEIADTFLAACEAAKTGNGRGPWGSWLGREGSESAPLWVPLLCAWLDVELTQRFAWRMPEMDELLKQLVRTWTAVVWPKELKEEVEARVGEDAKEAGGGAKTVVGRFLDRVHMASHVTLFIALDSWSDRTMGKLKEWRLCR